VRHAHLLCSREPIIVREACGRKARLRAFWRSGPWIREPFRQQLEEASVAFDRRRGRRGGISAGGIIVIIGILVLLFFSLWLGILIILVGLIGFGGFVRGRWY
jgi:hypothetical protein